MADGQLVVAERWYSATDLVGLPGLPTTVQGVRIMAERDGWTKRARAKGKGAEFDPSCLPENAKRELSRRAAISRANSAARAAGETVGRKLALTASIDAAVQQREREAGVARAAGLTGRAKERMDAKLDVLCKFDQFTQTFAGRRCMAMDAFCAAYRAGEIQMPVRSRLLVGDVSPASLRRWQRLVASQGSAVLAGDYGNRAGSGLIDSQPALRDFLLGLIADKPHIGAKNLHRVVSAQFARVDIVVPHVRSLNRFLDRLKTDHAQMFTAMSNPDAWKNCYMPAFGSASEDVVRLNQRWELDSTTAEVQLTDGRYTIVQICDIYSRRRLFYVAKTSSAAAVCEALRRAVLAWGIPESVKIDNGKDYVSERVQRAFRGLGVDVMISPPFSPWKKPHVERGFRTFLHGAFELLPGFAGHNVAEAQAIRSKESFAERMFVKGAVVEMRMSADELQIFCTRWIGIYENEPLEAENWPRGMTVSARVAGWTGEVRRITSERVLDLLLAEAPDGNGGRTVGKKGLRVEGHTYIAPELAALIGERVQVYYDERDIGRMVVYHDETFVCVAECPEIAGISRAEIAAAATAITKQRVADQRAAMRKLKGKIRKVDLVEAVLEHRAAPLALPPAENVIDATPQFEEAQRAVEALQKPAFNGVEELRLMQDVVELRRGDFDADAERKARIESAFERLARFDELDELAQRRLNNYITTSEFQGFKTMLDDFGPESMGLDPKFWALISDDAFAHTYCRAMAVGYFDPPTKG